MLVKLRLSLTVVFSSVMAFLIASNGNWTWLAVAVLAFGGFLVTGAANALNQVLEHGVMLVGTKPTGLEDQDLLLHLTLVHQVPMMVHFTLILKHHHQITQVNQQT